MTTAPHRPRTAKNTYCLGSHLRHNHFEFTATGARTTIESFENRLLKDLNVRMGLGFVTLERDKKGLRSLLQTQLILSLQQICLGLPPQGLICPGVRPETENPEESSECEAAEVEDAEDHKSPERKDDYD